MADNEVVVALDIVLEEVQAAIEDIAQRLAQAGTGEDFATAEGLADKGKQMKAFRDKVLALKGEWEQGLAKVSRARRRSKRRRSRKAASSARKTPQEAFAKPVLRALLEMGGSARVARVLDRVGQMMATRLNERDREALPSNPKTIRWRNSAQWARLRLVEGGLLASDSPRGVWRLTDQGKEAAVQAQREAGVAPDDERPSATLSLVQEQAGLWQGKTALTPYQDYTRQEVHDVLAPDAPFTPYSGTWGYHGIVPVPKRDGDFAFFVTFGQEQAEHKFREWVTEDGVLHWESQPSQGLDDRWIQQFIHHDERRNHIYLFLRTDQTIEYTYLGQLKYLSHDPAKERPVCFRWQILDWHPPRSTLERMGLKLRPAELTLH